MRTLIVDDSRFIRTMLATQGMECEDAADGLEGLADKLARPER